MILYLLMLEEDVMKVSGEEQDEINPVNTTKSCMFYVVNLHENCFDNYHKYN